MLEHDKGICSKGMVQKNSIKKNSLLLCSINSPGLCAVDGSRRDEAKSPKDATH